MIVNSLRWRMFGLALIWVAASLFLVALVLQYLFTINIERTARSEMEATVGRLAALILPGSTVPAIRAPLPDPLYSTPFGGKYWQIEALDNGETTRSRSLWDFVIPADGETTDGLRYLSDGPENTRLMVLTRQLTLQDGEAERRFLVSVAQDHAPIDAAIDSFRGDATILLLMLGLLLLLAAWLQIVLSLTPLAALRRGIDAIRRGTTDRLAGPHPTELAPLVDEINRLLATREQAMEKARRRAADLAHGLKTPLAALMGVADRLREDGKTRDADAIESLSVEMSERIDHQLRLAVLQQRTATHVSSYSLNTAVLRTVTVLKRTSRGEGLHWMLKMDEEISVDLHRQDLLELTGIVLENATKWAASQVVVRLHSEGGQAIVEVEDDGPGIDDDQMAGLGKRGVRLDESKPGTGLGLAMAQEILDMNNGSIAYERVDGGGLRVTLRLPRSPGEARA